MIALETERLILRPPLAADVPVLARLLDDFGVAKNLTHVPHPYAERDGYAFVALAEQNLARKEDFVFAIQRRADAAFLGCCGVNPKVDFELGYWLGRPYWGQGYATEAGRRLVRFAFDELGADRINSGWFFDNPASGRVLEKLGFGPCGEEDRACLSREAAVLCHKMAITRAAFARRKEER
jgi:RimJ/RimL family protein N-acetyltransferase